jgi:hypothetical protein
LGRRRAPSRPFATILVYRLRETAAPRRERPDEGTSDAGCCGVPGGGHVPLIVATPNGPRGTRASVPSNHYALLGAIEDAWGFGRLGHAADAGPAPLAGLLLPATTPGS